MTKQVIAEHNGKLIFFNVPNWNNGTQKYAERKNEISQFAT